MRNVQAGVMLLGSAAYLWVAALLLTRAAELPLVVGGWCAVLLIVTALVVVDSVRKARAGQTRKLATDLFIVKLAAIPFSLINFTVLTSVVLLGSGLVAINSELGFDFSAAWFLVAGVAISIGLTYLTILTTSTYGWATIAQLRRDGRIGAGLAVLYRVLLLLFVLDVVAGIMLYVHSRKPLAGDPPAGAEAGSRTPSPTPMRFVQAGTVLLGAVIYGFVIALAGQPSSADNLDWIFLIIGVWNTLLVVVTAFVVADSIRKVRARETRALTTDALVVKLTAIPFFLLNFLVLGTVAVVGLGTFLAGGVALLVAMWIGSGLTYLAMLSTSVYVWAAISQLRRDRIIGTGLGVLYTFMSFAFVTDIVAGVLLFVHARRRPGRALVIVLLALGVILAGVGFAPRDWGMLAFVVEFFGSLTSVGIVGVVVIVGTVVGSLIRLLVLRRRTQRLSAGEDPVKEAVSPQGSHPIGS
jgi:hypothetical protein